MKDIKKNYIVIQGWMPQSLNLKGNELIAFSLIFGFCQDQEGEFKGSIKYLSTWMNCSKPTTLKAINGLIEKDLIIKYQEGINGVIFNRFKINFKKLNSILDGVSRNFTPSKETLPHVKKLDGGSKETLQGGSKETLPNNIILDKDKNNIKEEFDFFFNDSNFLETFEEFKQIRKALKAPATKKAEKLILNKLVKFSDKDIKIAIEILERSIENGWKGVFQLNSFKQQQEETTSKRTWNTYE
jgi:hypothetical protein